MKIKFILIPLFFLLLNQTIEAQMPSPVLVDGNKVNYTQSYFNPKLKKEASVTNDYISFYQKYISGTRSTGCPMYPSCSNYGLKVFNERSLVTGFILTSDRLMRCGHEHGYYKSTLQDNGLRLIDYPSYDPAPKSLEYKKEKPKFAYSDRDADSIDVKLIKKLINNAFYSEALIEIYRFELKNKTFNKEVFVNKIICFLALNKQEDAIYDYEMSCPQQERNDAIIQFYISKSYLTIENWKQAIKHSTIGLTHSEDLLLSSRLLSLKALAQAKNNYLDEAKATYTLLQENPMFSEHAINSIQFINTYKAFKPKSPKAAGFLSIIPGLGYAYAGHKQTGLSALILNGLLFYATYSNIKNENYGMAALTGIFNLSFYIGNIDGSIKSTRRYNLKAKTEMLKKLELNTLY